jgi:hypothetical protein
VTLPRDVIRRSGEGDLPALLQVRESLDDCAQKLPFFLALLVVALGLELGDWFTPTRQQRGCASIRHLGDYAIRICLQLGKANDFVRELGSHGKMLASRRRAEHSIDAACREDRGPGQGRVTIATSAPPSWPGPNARRVVTAIPPAGGREHTAEPFFPSMGFRPVFLSVQAQRVEIPGRLRGHDVGARGLLRVLHALCVLADEVAAVDFFREVDEIVDVGGRTLSGDSLLDDGISPRRHEGHEAETSDFDYPRSSKDTVRLRVAAQGSKGLVKARLVSVYKVSESQEIVVKSAELRAPVFEPLALMRPSCGTAPGFALSRIRLRPTCIR